MKKNYFQFTLDFFANVITSFINISLFFVHYFAIFQILKTLFYPWKKTITVNKTPGFSLERSLNEISFNLISITIGFIMRMILIVGYIFIQSIIVVLFLPTIILFSLISPLIYSFYFIGKDEKTFFQEKKALFIKDRVIKQDNTYKADQWFEFYFNNFIKKKKLFDLNNLLSIQPIAKDWHYGYTPNLNNFGEEINEKNINFYFLVDREKETAQIEKALSQSNDANVLIIGDIGVGKHAILYSLAKKIYTGKTNPNLTYKRMFKIDLEKIFSLTEDNDKKISLLKEILDEAKAAENIILFIDNFEKYVAYNESNLNITNLLESYTNSNKLQFIAMTNPYYYQKYIFPNEKINKTFEKIEVLEIDKEKAKEIILENTFDFEKKYPGIIFAYEAIIEIIEKSDNFITYIPFPEKAIEIVHNTAARFMDIEGKKIIITPEMVDEIITQKTHIPTTLETNFKQKLINLEEELNKNVLFQHEALEKISSTIKQSFILNEKRKKPIASFLFLGKTGIGKTETAKTLAEILFEKKENLIRLDMSFYQSKEDIEKIIGSNNTSEPGILTKLVREKPYGILLIDEIEKAQENILNIFLTILDEGYFIDGLGKKVDTKNLIIIATSNAGSNLGFNKNISEKQIIDLIVENKIFTPEFLNRFDSIIFFNPLTKNDCEQLTIKTIKKIAQEIYNTKKIKISVKKSYLEKLMEKSFDERFGARNMTRVIDFEIKKELTNKILENKISGDNIVELE